MNFIKKIKVSWLNFIGIVFVWTICSNSSVAQCGISVPSKLVYLGLDPISSNSGSTKTIYIPITVKEDSVATANTVTWTSSDPQIIKILNNKPQFDLVNFGSQMEINLRASCPSASQTIQVSVLLLPAIYPRNAITGNSDSVNDFWEIINIEKFNSSLPLVKVFDRWGNKVFESKDGYRLHKFNGIDLSGGKFLSTGTYVYSIIPHPEYPEVLGELTLIR